MHEMLAAYFYARHCQLMRERNHWPEPQETPWSRRSLLMRLLRRG
ncbi:hypothetical protein M2360_001886 [Rhizobium sp. SG_E_25_P2]|nr:hypothetical protein [Rhizobium sp. SG_E_25_P2]MDH6266490.1 hypothetical protein [Rhizobium sp. SG_E_25_P2]